MSERPLMVWNDANGTWDRARQQDLDVGRLVYEMPRMIPLLSGYQYARVFDRGSEEVYQNSIDGVTWTDIHVLGQSVRSPSPLPGKGL